ncbi:MAG: hypothetical protein U5N26_07160 [Candidatus Marinimicrobia bacterium]|nr:hypothetical protein [Candidatus Neomarinimicrobiota bacterium]
MKDRFRTPLMILLSLILLFNASCEILTPLDPDEKARKEAWETIIEAHIMKQLWYYDLSRPIPTITHADACSWLTPIKGRSTASGMISRS